MTLVCNTITRGILPGVMVGVLTSDVSISPPVQLSHDGHLGNHTELVHTIRIEVVDVSRGGGRWEGVTGVPTRLPL